MAKRKLSLTPESEYTFPDNTTFGNEWAVLQDLQAQRMIAQHLTFLSFHNWLRSNVKHQLRNGEWRPVFLHVGEGFIKTDVLFYASICELALFSVAERFFNKINMNSPPEVIACFQREEERYREFCPKEIQVDLTGAGLVSTRLYGRSVKKVNVSEREVSMDMLIKACESIKLYDSAFSTRLVNLKDLRNGVHLKKHLKMMDGATFVYKNEILPRQVELVEELRKKIAAFTF